jgi:hypothetical protein
MLFVAHLFWDEGGILWNTSRAPQQRLACANSTFDSTNTSNQHIQMYSHRRTPDMGTAFMQLGAFDTEMWYDTELIQYYPTRKKPRARVLSGSEGLSNGCLRENHFNNSNPLIVTCICCDREFPVHAP